MKTADVDPSLLVGNFAICADCHTLLDRVSLVQSGAGEGVRSRSSSCQGGEVRRLPSGADPHRERDPQAHMRSASAVTP